MKKLFKSKLLLQVIAASIVATFATVGIVGAVTTIGANISTAGTLAVDTNTLYVGTTDRVGIGTSTPFASLSINNIAGDNAFVIGSSTATWLKVDEAGLLTVAKGATFSSTLDVSGITTLGNASTTVLSTSGGAYFNTASSTGLVSVNSLKVSAVGSTLAGVLFGTCDVNPQSIAAATSSKVSTSCAATGLTSSYKVFVTPPADTESTDNWLVFEGASASSTAGYIEISLFNASTTAAIDSPSRSWSWFAIK